MLLPMLTSFITTPIITRLFLPAEFGLWALASGLSDFLRNLSVSGFGSGAIRFFPEYKDKSKPEIFFVTMGGIIFITIAITTIISYSILHLLRNLIPHPLYPLLVVSILVFIVQAIFGVSMHVIRAQERSGLYTVSQLVSRYGSLGFGLLLVIVFGFQVDGLLWGEFLAIAVILPVLLISMIKGINLRAEYFRWVDAVQMWQYAWPLILGNIAMWGLRLSDRYIISFYRTESEVGLYSVAYNISTKTIDMIVMLFLLSMAPMVINVWVCQGREDAEKTLEMITRVFLIVCLPATAGLTLLASPFVRLLTTEAYHDGYRIVGYVAAASFMWGLAQIASRGILIAKDTNRIAVNQILAAMLNLGLNVILIPRFGFVAAGITTLIGYSILLILQIYSSRPYLTWRFPFKTLRNVTIATIFMGTAVVGVYTFPGSMSSNVHIGYLFLSILAGIVVYFSLIILLGEAKREEMEAVKNFMNRFARKPA
jgi:O-antigen/teichoic acid export membrane protein